MSSQITRRALQAIASEQGGYFTAQQALAVGYTYPKQHYHVAQGNWLKVARGLYRLAEYPKPPEAELMLLTLLSVDRQGNPQAVVSHETALALHELGDANPARIHLTVPRGFRKQMPPEVQLHRGALTERDWQEREGYRVTTPVRTLVDIASSPVSWPLLEGAVRDALARGLVRRKHLLADGLSARTQARLREALEEAGGSSQSHFPQEAGV